MKKLLTLAIINVTFLFNQNVLADTIIANNSKYKTTGGEVIKTKQPNIKRVWISIEDKQPEDIKEAKILYEINCKEGKYKTIAGAYYKTNNSISDVEADSKNEKYIIPKSNVETIAKYACNFKMN